MTDDDNPTTPDDGATTYDEWRVSGRPGAMFGHVPGPYDFTFSRRTNPLVGDPEHAARQFLATAEKYGRWQDGPHLYHRTVTVAPWLPVDDTPPEPVDDGGPYLIVPHGPTKPPYGSPERAAYDRTHGDPHA